MSPSRLASWLVISGAWGCHAPASPHGGASSSDGTGMASSDTSAAATTSIADDSGSGGGSDTTTGEPLPPSMWTRLGGTLSVDPQGWTNNPAIAAGPDGTVVAAWTQHRNPAVWEHSGIAVARYVDGAWSPLGGRIGHTEADGVLWPEAFDASVAVSGGTIYVAWYEGGGYGWANDHESAVFVAHWDGSAWVNDADAGDAFGALNLAPTHDARNPVLADIGGVLHVAWIENLAEQGDIDAIVVKRRDGDGWTTVGGPWNGEPTGTARRKLIDLAMVDEDGVPWVAWSEIEESAADGLLYDDASLWIASLQGDTFVAHPERLDADADGQVNYLSLAADDEGLHLAWQEKAGAGDYRIRTGHFDAGTWSVDAQEANALADGQPGRPALLAGAGGLVLAWSEGRPGEKAELYTRTRSGGAWSEVETPLSVHPGDGAVDAPALASIDGVPHVVWTEKHVPSATKQVYVARRGDDGDEVPVALTRYGSDGATPRLVPNTWTVLDAGGITVDAQGVGDEGYSSINYIAAAKRAVVFGKYHAVQLSYGEDQNALLGYDFSHNRWEVLEITENAWSEHLPGIGHDEGNVTVDGQRGLYLTNGNLTLNSGTGWTLYAYDLLAGRGQRLLPPELARPGVEVTGAFDAEHQLAYFSRHLYDVASNRFRTLADCPTGGFAGAAYHAAAGTFVIFGGAHYNGPLDSATYVVDVDAGRCVAKTPAAAPPGGYAHLAYDDAHQRVLAMSGEPLQLWAYDLDADSWTALPAPPADFPANAAGQKLTYDVDDDVLLFHDGVSLAGLRAFRYVPG
ncbi:MAG: hypothetical protein K1X88_05815 [Nannocystaceae bacterium]|nr:hypothetical protein [Nannocystaceae bacterium]